MIKLIILAIAFACIIVILKGINSDYFLPVLVVSSIILIYYTLIMIKQSFGFINDLIELSKIDSGFYKILFKILGISYLIEFSSGIIEDMGLKSLSDKLVLMGKVMIFIVSLPIFYSLYNLLISLIK